MRKSLRILILLICFSLLLPCTVSCANPTGNDNKPDYNNEYYDNSSREKTSGNLPDYLNLKGESVGVFYFQPAEMDVVGETEMNDMVYTSIYERNQKVEAWLNMKFNFIPSDSTFWNDLDEEVTNLVLMNDGSADVVIAYSNSIINQKIYYLFTDLNNTMYLEFNQPWWNLSEIKETSLDGRVYEFLYGDMLLSSITGCGAIFYNKRLFEEFNPGKGGDYLYTLVQNKTWTMDQFYMISNKTYLDRNGNENRDNEDIYAFQLFRHAEPIHYFANSAGIKYYERLKNGYPKITINSPKAVEFTELLHKIIFENNGADLYYPNQIGKELEHPHDFQDGRILFSLNTLGFALGEETRAMDDDYGIIPYPLWNENQEEYITLIANGAALACVPTTVTNGGNFDRLDNVIAPTLEAMVSGLFGPAE